MEESTLEKVRLRVVWLKYKVQEKEALGQVMSKLGWIWVHLTPGRKFILREPEMTEQGSDSSSWSHG